MPKAFRAANVNLTYNLKISTRSKGVYKRIISIAFYAEGHKYQLPTEGACQNSRAPQ